VPHNGRVDRPSLDPDAAAALRLVVARLSRRFSRLSTSVGLTPAQASALGAIAHHGPVTLAEVTRVEGINPTMMSRVAGRLEELGLIERHAHPDDQRAVVVEATAQGRAASRRIGDERAAVLAEAMDRLDPATRATIIDALPALEQLGALIASSEPAVTARA
jgi:DNA-binding MarR family transcriptional regulator